MVVLDRYVCLDDPRLTDPRTTHTEHVYFQIEDIQHNPGYIYLKERSLTKLELVSSASDRLVTKLVNENGYLSSQMLNKLLYETCTTCEKQTKDLVGVVANQLGVDESSIQSLRTIQKGKHLCLKWRTMNTRI